MRRDSETPLDGNALRTQRTRNRVLAESLRLFNEMGESRVTIGTIAIALDMSAGNLYYHFRNKDQIVEELFARFEVRIDVEPRTNAGGADAIEDLWLYLHLMLEAIWEYRFLYGNLDDLLSRSRKLREHFARIVERKFAVVVALCEGLVGARAMRARPEEVRTLAGNVLLVATYWLSFQALRAGARGRAPGGDGDLGRGAYQVMALIAPYLLGEAREHLDRLSRNYID
ncbi:MAG: TetR/AcrR family transcriptional regulator [Usitatibacter sp.]